MLGLAFVAVGSFADYLLLVQVFVRPSGFFFPCADVLSSCGDFFGSHAPWASPSSPSLPSEGRDEGGGSRDALVLLPEGLPLLPLDFCPAGGVEEPLDARSMHASSLLSPRFIRGLGRQGVAILYQESKKRNKIIMLVTLNNVLTRVRIRTRLFRSKTLKYITRHVDFTNDCWLLIEISICHLLK